MDIDSYIAIGLAVFTCITIPLAAAYFSNLRKEVALLRDAIKENTAISVTLNNNFTRLEEHVASGVEPRVGKCEDNIGTLFDRTNDHGSRLSVLEHKQV